MKFTLLGLAALLGSASAAAPAPAPMTDADCKKLSKGACKDPCHYDDAVSECKLGIATNPEGHGSPGKLGGNCDAVYKETGPNRVKYSTPPGGIACEAGSVCRADVEPGDGIAFKGICVDEMCHGKQDPETGLNDLDPTNEATIRVTICHRTCSQTNPWVRITIDDDAWNGTAASGCGHMLQHDIRDECANKAPWDEWGVNRKDYLIRWHGTRDYVRKYWNWTNPTCTNGNCKFSPEEKDYWFFWERACPYVRRDRCCGYNSDKPWLTTPCCGDVPYPNQRTSLDLEKKVVALGAASPCANQNLMDRGVTDLEVYTGNVGAKVVYYYEVYNNGEVPMCNIKLSDALLSSGAFTNFTLQGLQVKVTGSSTPGIMKNGCLYPGERVCLPMPNNGVSTVTGPEKKPATVVGTPFGVIPGGPGDKGDQDTAEVALLPPPAPPVLKLEKKVGPGENLKECPSSAFMADGNEEYTDAQNTKFTYYYQITNPVGGVKVCNILLSDPDIYSGKFTNVAVNNALVGAGTMENDCLKPGQSVCIGSGKIGTVSPEIPDNGERKFATVTGTNEEKLKTVSASDDAGVMPVSIKLVKEVGPGPYTTCPNEALMKLYVNAANSDAYYTYTIENTGDKTLCSVKLSDPLLKIGSFKDKVITDASMTNGCLAPSQKVCVVGPKSTIPNGTDDKEDEATVVALPEGPVGNEVKASDKAGVLPTAISIETKVDGGSLGTCPVDMSDPTKLELYSGPAGTPVTYFYLIKNEGSVPLCHIFLAHKIADNGFGSPISGIEMPNGCLEPGKSMCYIRTSTIPPTGESVPADVEAVPSYNIDSPFPGAPKVKDSDPAGTVPAAIGLQKKVEEGIKDDKCPLSDYMTAIQDESLEDAHGFTSAVVTYFYFIKNTGLTTLCNVKLSDPEIAGAPFDNYTLPNVGGMVNGCLPPGAELCVPTPVTFTGGSRPIIPAGGETKEAIVVGTPSDNTGKPLPSPGVVRDINDASVVDLGPVTYKIGLTKEVGDGDYTTGCPNEALMKLSVGLPKTRAWYTYTIENTGNQVLCNVKLSDKDIQKGAFQYRVIATPDMTKGCLAPKQKVCVAGEVASEIPDNDNDKDDMAVVTANPEGSTDDSTAVQATDNAGVLPIMITLEKKVVLDDGTGFPSGCPLEGLMELIAGAPGTKVRYTYTVKNIGGVEVCGITVADSLLTSGAVTALPVMPSGCLAPLAEMCVVGPVSLIPPSDADKSDVATATGKSKDGANTVTASDDAGVVPTGVNLEKKVIIGDVSECPLAEIMEGDNLESAEGVVGSKVTFFYNVTNTGAVPLCGLFLQEGLGGVDLSGVDLTKLPGMVDGCLPPGASICFSLPSTVTDTPISPGDATVSGTPTTDGSKLSEPVTDTNGATVKPLKAGITLVKKVVLDDGSTYETCPLAGLMDLLVGVPETAIRYVYTATNTGEATLCNVLLTDPDLEFSPITEAAALPMLDGCLAPGASACIVGPSNKIPANDGDKADSAVVTAVPKDSSDTVTASDYAGVLPTGIELTKKVIAGTQTTCPSADKMASDEYEVAEGKKDSTVTYIYNVYNPGPLPMCDIAVTDDKVVNGLSGVDIATLPGMENGCLPPFKSICILVQGPVPPETQTEPASASGVPTYPDGTKSEPVDDQDPATVKTLPPGTASISLVKWVTLDDGSAYSQCPAQGLMDLLADLPATAVRYTYTATNTGEQVVCNVQIIDPLLEFGKIDVPLLMKDGCLDPGASVCIVGPKSSIPANENDKNDIAKVTAVSQETNTNLEAVDGAGVLPTSVVLEKKVIAGIEVSCPDKDKMASTTELELAKGKKGSDVTYFYSIYNPGPLPLCNLDVTDAVENDLADVDIANLPGMENGCLPPGVTICFTAHGKVPTERQTVPAKVSGVPTYPDGATDKPKPKNVTDEDDATVEPLPPGSASLEFEKKVILDDGSDYATVGCPLEGLMELIADLPDTAVRYVYTAKNPGEQALCNVVVIDPLLDFGAITAANPLPMIDGCLPPGATACVVGPESKIPANKNDEKDEATASAVSEETNESLSAGDTAGVVPTSISLTKKVAPGDQTSTGCPDASIMASETEYEVAEGKTGTLVTYIYSVYNPGPLPMCGVTVNDDEVINDLAQVVIKDLPGMIDGCLPSGGSICFSVSGPVPKNEQSEPATATGVPTYPDRSTGKLTKDEDAATVKPLPPGKPAIDLQKQVVLDDGRPNYDSCPADGLMDLIADLPLTAVRYVYTATNTGDQTLCGVRVVDPNLVSGELDKMLDGCLEPQASVCFVGPPSQIPDNEDDKEDAATVTATSKDTNEEVTDTDTAGVMPTGVDLIKKVIAGDQTGSECPSADKMAGPDYEVAEGKVNTDVTYIYSAYNPGPLPLCNLDITDAVDNALDSVDIASLPVMVDGCLPVGGTVCFSVLGKVPSTEESVPAHVSGNPTYPDGTTSSKPVEDDDPATVIPLPPGTPSITLLKQVVLDDGTDYSACPAEGLMDLITAAPATAVRYVYTATNNGDTVLCNVVIVDPVLVAGAITIPLPMLDGCLEPGAVACIVGPPSEIPSDDSDKEDVATVTAHSDEGDTDVSASDAAGVLPEGCPYPMPATLPKDLCQGSERVAYITAVSGSPEAEAYLRGIEESLLYDVSFVSDATVVDYGFKFKVNNPFGASTVLVRSMKPIGKKNAYGDECFPMKFDKGCPAEGAGVNDYITTQCIKGLGHAHSVVDLIFVTGDDKASGSTATMPECCESAATEIGLPIPLPEFTKVVKATVYIHCECPMDETVTRKLRGT